MAESTVPGFFDAFPMRRVRSDDLDAVLAEDAAALSILFLWGRDCVNCDVAKREMLATPDAFRWPGVRWLHANVYDDPGLGVRFGLHGVPTFLVFRGARRLGRISPWPGRAPFVAAIEQQLAPPQRVIPAQAGTQRLRPTHAGSCDSIRRLTRTLRVGEGEM